MSSSMVVHDTRLAGTAPFIAPNTYTVNGSVELRNALSWITRYARSNGGLTDLYFMCHGFEGGINDTNAQQSVLALGFGLQLCREGLNNNTVSMTRCLNGLVSVIWLYACGPANTHPGTTGSRADGERLCMELAAYTNAEVIAGTQTQWYHMRGANQVIDFGAWEGPVYRFFPDGTKVRFH